MPLFRAAIAEAFASAPLSGNPAGVVVLGRAPFPEDALAIRIAAELRHSETAFVRDLGGDEFALRYFTPVCEAALCGHATVAAFTLLRDKLRLAPGEKLVHT
ncbi:MAG: PhzF family phenazine biosynthesis protein, partial [Clostridia bacterium]|nr:PhzF family phenazine biosynthesis protein [Clostridia bacterium]